MAPSLSIDLVLTINFFTVKSRAKFLIIEEKQGRSGEYNSVNKHFEKS